LEQEIETRNVTLEHLIKEKNEKSVGLDKNGLTDISELLNGPVVSSSSSSPMKPDKSSSGNDENQQMITVLINQRDRYKEKLTVVSALSFFFSFILSHRVHFFSVSSRLSPTTVFCHLGGKSNNKIRRTS
jgi:hypothetical protein